MQQKNRQYNKIRAKPSIQQKTLQIVFLVVLMVQYITYCLFERTCLLRSNVDADGS